MSLYIVDIHGEIEGDYEIVRKYEDQESFKPMVEIDLYSVIKQKYIERDVLDKIRAEIEQKCDRINSLASVLPYTAHREIQELLCEIIDLCKAEGEIDNGNDDK